MADERKSRSRHAIQGQRWPALMTQATAAAYLDGSVALLEKQVSRGIMPIPIFYDGKPMWRKEAIDLALARLAGEVAPDWRDRSPLYHPELEKPKPKRRW